MDWIPPFHDQHWLCSHFIMFSFKTGENRCYQPSYISLPFRAVGVTWISSMELKYLNRYFIWEHYQRFFGRSFEFWFLDYNQIQPEGFGDFRCTAYEFSRFTLMIFQRHYVLWWRLVKGKIMEMLEKTGTQTKMPRI